MMCQREPTRSMFWTKSYDLSLPGATFASALSQATTVARERAGDVEVMLIAWYDREGNRISPQVECCSDEMPGWLVYAKSRGGDTIVSVNEESFIFVFLTLPVERDPS